MKCLKHIVILLIWFLMMVGLMVFARCKISNAIAADTVWITKDSVEHSEWLPLGDSVLVGDANGSGFIDIDDMMYLQEYIFLGGQAPMIYHTVDIYFKWTGECGIVLDSTGWPIDWIYKGRTGTRFGQVSGQEWNDSL